LAQAILAQNLSKENIGNSENCWRVVIMRTIALAVSILSACLTQEVSSAQFLTAEKKAESLRPHAPWDAAAKAKILKEIRGHASNGITSEVVATEPHNDGAKDMKRPLGEFEKVIGAKRAAIPCKEWALSYGTEFLSSGCSAKVVLKSKACDAGCQHQFLSDPAFLTSRCPATCKDNGKAVLQKSDDIIRDMIKENKLPDSFGDIVKDKLAHVLKGDKKDVQVVDSSVVDKTVVKMEKKKADMDTIIKKDIAEKKAAEEKFEKKKEALNAAQAAEKMAADKAEAIGASAKKAKYELAVAQAAYEDVVAQTAAAKHKASKSDKTALKDAQAAEKVAAEAGRSAKWAATTAQAAATGSMDTSGDWSLLRVRSVVS